MNAEDFQDLYKLLRGSRSAFGVLDARTLFIEKQIETALQKVQESRDTYEQSRSRLMKRPPEQQVDKSAPDAERQIRRLERKQTKVREIMEKFDEILAALQKLYDRDKAKEEKRVQHESPQTPVSTSDQNAVAIESCVRPAQSRDVTRAFAAQFASTQGDEQLELISRHFGFQPVESEDDIHPDAIYFIKIGDESFLVHTVSADAMGDGVPLVSAVDETPMKTYSRESFLGLGARRRMVLLTTESSLEDDIDSMTHEIIPDDDTDYGTLNSSEDTVMMDAGRTIEQSPDSLAHDQDARASGELSANDFNQLLEAVQRSGLVPDVDLIAHYRDREFRLGCYDMVYAGIESMFVNFTAAAKDLQSKRSSDQQVTQAIELARKRFQKVLHGLQALMAE